MLDALSFKVWRMIKGLQDYRKSIWEMNVEVSNTKCSVNVNIFSGFK
jgi:hypothetical protein